MELDRKKLVLLGALIVAIGTGLAALSIVNGGEPAPKAVAAKVEPVGPQVMVAQRALPVGTILTADSVSFQPWPKELVRDAYFLEGEADVASLLGTVVRQTVTAGEPLTRGSLVSPKDRGFLAAALGPGMRAITVPVTVKTGVGGFIFPGDRVDVMLAQSVKAEDGPPLKAVETIVRNVRVLATDQSTAATNVDGKTVVRTFRTVTLEVTPRIAEKVTVAQNIGAISLALRSIADNQAELDRAIASGAVKVPEGASRTEEDRILQQVSSRPMDGASTFVTGGDVSRFQRRNARPAAPAVMPAYVGPPAPAPDPGPLVRVTRGKKTDAVQTERF